MWELAEDELKRFFKVWASVFASLSYCYIIGNLITPKGYRRVLAILPIIGLFFALPLYLTSFHFGGMTSFFIAWLTNFKLILFAFGKGPLSSYNNNKNSSSSSKNENNSSISFLHFLAIGCLPIKAQEHPPEKNSSKPQINQDPNLKYEAKPYSFHKNKNLDHKSHNDLYSFISEKYGYWNYMIKGVLLGLILKIYDYSDYVHPKIIWLNYYFHMYLALELILALLGSSAKLLLDFELEPQFNEPLLSTSLQDFWSRRWNLMVSQILRPTVYLPTLEFSTRVIGRSWAPLTAIMATFLVSGVMHEVIFYYLGRVVPTFEVTWFFLLHGFCLCVEVVVKKSIGRRLRVPWWISGPATVGFVVGSGFWLFLPPLERAGMDTRPFQEYAAAAKFLRSLKGALTFY